MGDFNINLLYAESSHFAQGFLLSLQRFPFIPTIDKPTLAHNSSATLIDNIWPTKLMLISPVAKLSLISATILSQFCVSHTLLRGRIQESKSAAIFLVSPLICLTLKTNFDDQFDVDNSFSNFCNTLSGFVQKDVPLETLSKCKLKQFS